MDKAPRRLLMYANVCSREKTSSSQGEKFPSVMAEGGHWTSTLASLFCPSASSCNQDAFSCRTGSERRRWSTFHPPVAVREAWPWPLWQKGHWSGPWLFQCFLPSRRPLRFHFVRGNTWGERSNVGSACSFWQKLAFILRPNGSSSCLFTGRGKANKVSYECLDQFASMVMAHSHVRRPQCLLIKWRPHWMLIVKSCTSAQVGGRGSHGGGCWLLQEPQWMETMLESCKHYWNNRCSTTSDVLQSFTFSFERVPSLCRPWKSSLNNTTP